jgi:phosphoglycolate phosphatase
MDLRGNAGAGPPIAPRGVSGDVRRALGGSDHLRREAAHLGWDRVFGSLVGATDAARDKPSAEPVAMALAGSGITTGPDVWFVGDTGIDMECAYNSGLLPVLVREAAPQRGEFADHAPRLHFHSCSGLAALVRTF